MLRPYVLQAFVMPGSKEEPDLRQRIRCKAKKGYYIDVGPTYSIESQHQKMKSRGEASHKIGPRFGK
jgi:hypothetical protein